MLVLQLPCVAPQQPLAEDRRFYSAAPTGDCLSLYECMEELLGRTMHAQQIFPESNEVLNNAFTLMKKEKKGKTK